MRETAYYYNLLSREGKQAYHAMKTGMENISPSFSVPRLSGEEISQIFFCLRLDCPNLFYIPKYSYRFYSQADSIEFIPEYLFPKAKVLEHKSAMTSRVKKLVNAASKLSDYEKLLYIHDFICDNIHYDKLKKPYSHEIIGALGQGVAVCEGIAKSVKMLCDEMNIWCIIAISENNPDKGIKYRHAWNIVQLNGKYYHLDCTFDNTLSKRCGLTRYDYFLTCDSQLFRDHEPVIWKTPICSETDHMYYREKKLSFTKYEDVRNRASQCAKKSKPLVFHWRGGYMTREVLKDIIPIFEQEGAKRSLRPIVTVNWSQAIIMLSYEKDETVTEWVEPMNTNVEFDVANEGELYEEAE